MHKPYLHLDWNIPVLKEGYSVPHCEVAWIKIFRVDYEYLTKEFVELFEYYTRSKPTNVQLFYTPPNVINRNIHVDGTKSNTMWAINKVIAGNMNGVMRWFKSDIDTVKQHSTGISTKYSSYEISEVTEIDRTIIEDISLVEIGIPHNIDNASAEPRWCLSVRPDRYHFTYHELYNRFTA